MYTESSLKLFLASALAVKYEFSNSFSFRTTLIPFPPPPREALIITGYPIFLASDLASSKFLISPSLPGIIGIFAFFIISRAIDLLPIIFIISLLGPINFILHSSHIPAKLAFSDKNPKPG